MKPIKIIDNLYLGDANSGKDIELLRKFNIIAIVNISGGKLLFQQEIKYLRINITDSNKANIADYLDEVTQFILDNVKLGGVLVHCQAGISRSPSFIVAFLAKHNNMSVTDALAYVKKCRPSVRPKDKFIESIRSWHEKKN
ncbi:MAG: dual specificity protein phosphatase 10 [Harvfovirus sp.]|uniref:Dual specificity protein phosphatase 10 n=1 Tax=Harvfovirus sp. TaxID=2487768 RepID=A0A3G5A191_9VIRU|nr:MAG: dual specificity protein phosphatase 10 [Harvfovirus sp.]